MTCFFDTEPQIDHSAMPVYVLILYPSVVPNKGLCPLTEAKVAHKNVHKDVEELYKTSELLSVYIVRRRGTSARNPNLVT